MEIKSHQRKIADLIKQNRDKHLAEKQMQYQMMKEQNLRARSNIKINNQRGLESTQEGYYCRIENKYKEAERTKYMTRMLE